MTVVLFEDDSPAREAVAAIRSGDVEGLRKLLAHHPGLEPSMAVSVAFWCACHGGQLEAAEYLLERGADLNWVASWDGLTPLDAARRSEAHDVVGWLVGPGGGSARSAASVPDQT